MEDSPKNVPSKLGISKEIPSSSVSHKGVPSKLGISKEIPSSSVSHKGVPSKLGISKEIPSSSVSHKGVPSKLGISKEIPSSSVSHKGVPSKLGISKEIPSSSGKTFPIKIGLEIHGYLDTHEKLFCMCKTNGDEKPNSRICPICTGTPGSKPMAPNIEAIKKVIQIALIFKSRINYSNIAWQRKHYNWADNPKGYQTTISGAHATPNAVGGKFKGINLTELHLEEDPAQWNPDSGKVNYNRSGLPLIEIVTEPEFSDSEQVVEWLKSLLLTLSYIKAVRKNAGIKVDVNVSTYGERVEMKNLNSLEKIKKAINYEIARQVENYEKGIVQTRDTLAFDEKLGKTIKMRSKEGATDYRFISDPDLPLIKLGKKLTNEIKAKLPEMPEVKLENMVKGIGIDKENAKILARNLELVEFVESIAGFKKIGESMAAVLKSGDKWKETFNAINNYQSKWKETFNAINNYQSKWKETFNAINNYQSKWKETFNAINNYRNAMVHLPREIKGKKESEDIIKLLDKTEKVLKNRYTIDVPKNIFWITVELLRILNYNKKTLEDEDVEILPEHLAELIKAVEDGKITKLKGKQIMNDFIPKSFSLKEHKGEVSNIDKAAIENLCRQVIDENIHVVDEYKNGKVASLNYLIGQVMRLSERRADFRTAGDCLKEMINGD